MTKWLSATAAAVVLLGACAASAQTTKAPDKAPVTKTEKKPKAKSACNAITEEAACKADATCTWIAALVDAKTSKQKRKAYCKTKPKPPVKKSKDAKAKDATKDKK